MAFFPGFPSLSLLCCSCALTFPHFCRLTGSLYQVLHPFNFEVMTQNLFQLVAQPVGNAWNWHI